MSPNHHPSDDILTAYAAGALEPGFGLVVGLGALVLQRLVVQRRLVECAQVLALVEVHEVGGGEEQAGVADLHSSPYGR